MQVINTDWLERMLEHFVKSDVGAVGAKLYYPNGTIEHAGFITGIGYCGYGAHSHIGFPRDSYGYFGRLKTVQNYRAVTGACLMTKRNTFEKLDGFDEQFEYNYNDVDLCARIWKAGWRKPSSYWRNASGVIKTSACSNAYSFPTRGRSSSRISNCARSWVSSRAERAKT